MMKRTLLLVAALLIGSLLFSMIDEPAKKINLKGKCGITVPNSVQVTMDRNKTLITTFYKDVENVTITVRKKSGEVISVETVDAKEWDSYLTNLPNYKEGEYVIEISTPEGKLSGHF